MKRISVILMIVFLSLANPILAQEKGYEYVVTMKSGVTLRGVFVKKEANGFLVLQNPDKGLITINAQEISFMQREELPANAPFALQSLDYEGELGFQLSPGLMMGLTNETENGFSFQAVGFYQVNPLLAIGIGTGIERFTDGTWLPLFAHVKLETDGLFFAFNGGYTSLLHDEYYFKRGGFMSDVEIGFKFPVSGGRSFYISSSYRYQQAEAEEMIYALDGSYYENDMYPPNYDYRYEQKLNFHFLVFRVGIIF